jgi:ferrous iron transport protein A
MTLAEAPAGARLKVLRIAGGAGVRNRLAVIGIYPGAVLKVLKPPPGPMIVEIGGMRVAVGKGVALKIEVEEAG